jgi:LAS superfamily LD-carboxypeptidase LdcB
MEVDWLKPVLKGVRVMATKEVTLDRLQAAQAAAKANGIVLTPEEAYKAAGKKFFNKVAKRRKKNAKKRKGGSPFLPGSFESSSR